MAHAGKTLVLSSEHFTLLKPGEIAALHRYLGRIARQSAVVLYVRHPRAVPASKMQEGIKNGARTLESLRTTPLLNTYERMVPKWVEVFGKQALVLREFNPQGVGSWNIVADFLDTIQYIGDSAAIEPTETKNMSLSGAGVLIANALAKIAPKFSSDRGSSEYLSRIRGPAFQPDDEMMAGAQGAIDEDLEYLRAEWGITPADSRKAEAGEEVFTPETIESLAEILNELSRKSSD